MAQNLSYWISYMLTYHQVNYISWLNWDVSYAIIEMESASCLLPNHHRRHWRQSNWQLSRTPMMTRQLQDALWISMKLNETQNLLTFKAFTILKFKCRQQQQSLQWNYRQNSKNKTEEIFSALQVSHSAHLGWAFCRIPVLLTGIILCICLANERWHYIVTSSHWLGAYKKWSLCEITWSTWLIMAIKPFKYLRDTVICGIEFIVIGIKQKS